VALDSERIVVSLDRKCLGAKVPGRSRSADRRDIFDKETRRNLAFAADAAIMEIGCRFGTCARIGWASIWHGHPGLADASRGTLPLHVDQPARGLCQKALRTTRRHYECVGVWRARPSILVGHAAKKNRSSCIAKVLRRSIFGLQPWRLRSAGNANALGDPAAYWTVRGQNHSLAAAGRG